MKNNENIKRAIIKLSGRVQGVGFRPFVFRLAKRYSIRGNVLNDLGGVSIDAEGNENDLANFIKSLDLEKPPLAVINAKTFRFKKPAFYNDFKIQESDKKGNRKNAPGNQNLTVSPDIAICDECLKELLNPVNRRYLYPFINCTDCGPRFTIIKGMPYDRVSTVMDKFKMCSVCVGEYKNPLNRRFHAEPNGCFLCGPEVEFILNDNLSGKPLQPLNSLNHANRAQGFKAIKSTVELLRNGGIVCVKGIGGFHLMADATNDKAVKSLRERKNRPAKPFAVMLKDIYGANGVLKYAYLDNISSSLMLSKERPIVLLRDKGNLSYFVNCGMKNIGIFLPYAPIHYIIFNLFDKPLVATSANIGGEPIVKDNMEAISKLKSIADGFLIHNRDIHRRCDDSVIKAIGEDWFFIRRSRGYVPDSIKLPFKLKRNVLSVGSFLKNTFAISYKSEGKSGGGAVILSQHNGDLDNMDSFVNFTENVEDFERFYNFKPEVIVCDSHPAYENTKWAKEKAAKEGVKCVSLQHHRAHIISCMAENGLGLKDNVFGAAFDGTGYGDDGSIWGGEFFKGSYMNLKRVGSFKKFRLIGGDKAVKSPQRVLLSILFGLFFENEVGTIDGFELKTIANLTGLSIENIKVFLKMWKSGINSPYSSSCGRIFDAVSCLCGFMGDISYEGEAAMYLEDLCGSEDGEKHDNQINKTDFFEYNIGYDKTDGLFIIDYSPMFNNIVKIIINNSDDLKTGGNIMDYELNGNGISELYKLRKELYKNIAGRFINTLALIIRDMALRMDCKNVCLSGGVFQNSFLLDKTAKILKKNGFNIFFNKKIPPNDGGISFGQAVYGGIID